MISKEEFIGRAADALLRAGGFDPDRADLGMRPIPGAPASALGVGAEVQRLHAVAKAEAVLEAVGAWQFYTTAEVLVGYHTGPGLQQRTGSVGGCSNCGGIPHSSTCHVAAFEVAIAKAEGR